jgi:hypothetical protein
MRNIDIDDLWQQTQNALKLTAKERFAKLKQIGFKTLALFNENKDPTLEELKVYADILRIVLKIPLEFPRLNTGLSKIIAKTLPMIGCEKPKIIKKISKVIEPFAGLVGICDKSFGLATDDFDFGESLKLINEGKIYLFLTPFGEIFNLQVRVIDAPEPVLTMRDYKKVVKSSSPVIISVPTGKLYVDDGSVNGGDKPEMEISVEPGNYKCQVYLFEFPRGRLHYDFSYTVVLSKTEKQAVNNECEIADMETNFDFRY